MEVNNSDFIYMDFNATTPLADEVVAGIQKSLVTDWGNPSSAHQFGAAAKDAISTARKQIADMLHCTPNEITFTSGGTEANNMVIWNAIHYFQKCVNSCAGSKFLDKPHIITTNVEHDSIILPIRYLEKQSYVTCSVIKVKILSTFLKNLHK